VVNKVGGDGMKIERTKNASRNIVFGTLLKLYQVIGPFLMRTAMIYLMGVQYLGLNSLFTSILQVLNLAELGVGSAMIYSMYKPIADDNKTMICALMKLYRTYYRVIGLVIALVGGFLTPFIPRLISGEVPNGINIYVLYLLNLGATVLSYWLFAKKSILLLWPGYKASITRLLYPAPPPPPPPTALIIKFLALGGGVNSQWSALTTGVGASCEYDECIPSSSISQVHWPCGMFSRLLFFFVITGIVAIVIKLTTKRAIKASAREKPLQAECFGETFFILFKSFNSTFLCFYT